MHEQGWNSWIPFFEPLNYSDICAIPIKSKKSVGDCCKVHTHALRHVAMVAQSSGNPLHTVKTFLLFKGSKVF